MRRDGEVRLANPETWLAYETLSSVLDDNGYMRGTSNELPHAHSILLRTARRSRLVHIFDPSGERLDSRERTNALRYMQYGWTFLFVLDPTLSKTPARTGGGWKARNGHVSGCRTNWGWETSYACSVHPLLSWILGIPADSK